jgi:hypothetical protein
MLTLQLLFAWQVPIPATGKLPSPTHPLYLDHVLPAVNAPGHFFALGSAGAVSAVECPPDTYCPGLKKQRACVPCPTGFTTNGLTGQYSPAACGTLLDQA